MGKSNSATEDDIPKIRAFLYRTTTKHLLIKNLDKLKLWKKIWVGRKWPYTDNGSPDIFGIL